MGVADHRFCFRVMKLPEVSRNKIFKYGILAVLLLIFTWLSTRYQKGLISMDRTPQPFPVKPNNETAHVKTNVRYQPLDWKSLLNNNASSDWPYLADSKRSEMYVEKQKDSYYVGDIVNVKIVSRDHKNRRKNKGGDEIRIWIKDLKNNASAAGYVNDNLDGTYQGTVKLFWPGNITIMARISTPREITAFILRTVETGNVGRRYYAQFVNDTSSETTVCTASENIIAKYKQYCNLTKINSDLPWYCEMPLTLPCSSWHFVADKPVKMSLSTEERLMIQKFCIKLPLHEHLSPLEITVVDQNSAAVKLLNKEGDLLPCNEIPSRLTWISPPPIGYQYKGKWIPTFCRSTYDGSVAAFNKCLTGKRFWLFGDSTSRQFFKYFQEFANLTLLTKKWLQPKWYEFSLLSNANRTLKISWAIHALPFLFNYKPRPYSEAKGTHVYIDTIPAGSRDIVLVHFYSHYLFSPVHVLRDSVRKTVEAIKNLKARAPDVKVLVKGPHACIEDRWSHIQLSDVWGTIYQQILKEEFYPVYDFVKFLDLWDITVAAENELRHPENSLLKEIIAYMMSLICP